MYMKKELFELESNVPTEKKGKPEGFFAPSALHPHRLADAMELVSRLDGVATVLDVGCGYGDMYAQLVKKFPDVKYVGIDPVEWVLQEAANRLPEGNVELYCCDLSDFHADHQFDVVLCLGVMAMIDKSVAPNFVAKLYQHAKQAIVLEWHDSRKYAGKFTAYEPTEMTALFSHPFRSSNSVKRDGESSLTTLIEV